MDFLFALLSLAIVVFIGFLFEEEKEYILILFSLLIVSGILVGYFLGDMMIYGILFVLGVVVERIFIRYKWMKTKKPKSADYKSNHDWLMKVLSMMTVILAIDMVSEINVLYTFLAFSSGLVVSWFTKRFEK